MLTIDSEIFLNRKEVSNILNVSVHTLEIWCSRKDHPVLHLNSFKFRGRAVHYKLLNVEEHFKKWDAVGYEYYTKHVRPKLFELAKTTA